MHQLFREVKFQPPDGKCLSPAGERTCTGREWALPVGVAQLFVLRAACARCTSGFQRWYSGVTVDGAASPPRPSGEYNLLLGIQKRLQPELVVTHQETVSVFEGHPFIVEVGVSLNSKNQKKPGDGRGARHCAAHPAFELHVLRFIWICMLGDGGSFGYRAHPETDSTAAPCRYRGDSVCQPDPDAVRAGALKRHAISLPTTLPSALVCCNSRLCSPAFCQLTTRLQRHRLPLPQGSDVTTRVSKKIPWARCATALPLCLLRVHCLPSLRQGHLADHPRYKINKKTDKIGVVTSIVRCARCF